MIKNLFRFCVLSLFLATSVPTFADTGSDGASCPIEVENRFEPISQRFVLALLGANASVEFLEPQDLTMNEKERILKMTPDEAAACSAPFPSKSYKSVQSVLLVLYSLTVALWAMLVGVYAFASFYSKQSSGDSEHDEEGLILKFARSTTLMLICAPIMTVSAWMPSEDEEADKSENPLGLIDYSPLHNTLFRAIGYSVGTAEKIDASFKSHYAVDNPKYLVPRPAFPLKNVTANIIQANEGSFGQSIEFAMCVQNVTNGQRINVDQIDAKYSGNVKHIVSFNYEGCGVTFEMNKDMDVVTALGFIDKVADIKVNIDYAKDEKETFLTLSKTLIEMSLGFAYGVTNNLLHKNPDNLKTNKESEVDTTFESIEKWHEQCVYDFDGMAQMAMLAELEGGGASLSSIYKTKVLAQHCLARTVTQKLGYPRSYKDNYNFDTMSEEKKLPLTYRQYQACSFAGMAGKAVDYKSCVVEVCENIDPYSKESGLFECAVLVDVARTSALEHYFDKLGFMASPAMILNRLGDGKVPTSPQKLLTSFKMTESSMNIPSTGRVKEIIDALYVASNLENTTVKFTEYDYELSGKPQRNESVTEKLLACFINPSSVIRSEDGSITNCKHPINELHDIGIYMLKIYGGFVTGALIRSTSSLFQGMKKPESKGTDGGIEGEKKAPETKTDTTKKEKAKGWQSIVASKLVQIGLAAAGGGAINTMINGLSADSFIGSQDPDDSPYWYNESNNLLNMSAGGAAVLGYMMSGNIFDKEGKLDNDSYNKASRKVNSNVSMFAMFFLIVGFVLAFIVPVAPAAIFYATLITVFANMLALVFSATYHVIYALAGTGKDVKQKLLSLLNKWLLMLLRLPLLVVGFYLSYSLMITTLPPFALATADVVQVSGVLDTGIQMVTEFLRWGLSMILFGMIMFLVMFALFDAITGPFYLTRGLVFSDDSGEALGKSDTTKTLNDNVKFFRGL
jgi:hypothetical protein